MGGLYILVVVCIDNGIGIGGEQKTSFQLREIREGGALAPDTCYR